MRPAAMASNIETDLLMKTETQNEPADGIAEGNVGIVVLCNLTYANSPILLLLR